MLHLISRKERVCRVAGGIHTGQPHLDKVIVRCSDIGEREELNEGVAVIDSRVLHEVPVVEEGVSVTHCRGLIRSESTERTHGLTECHAENHIVLSQQAERGRDGLERAHTDRLASRADHVKVAARDVERVDRVLYAAELEREVEQLVTRDGPDLGLLVVLRALDATVDGIRHRTRHLGKGESGVKHCNQLAIGRARHDRVDCDRLTIGTDDAIHVGQYLPVLVLVR